MDQLKRRPGDLHLPTPNEHLQDALREGLAAYLGGFLPAAESDIAPGYLTDELMEHVVGPALRGER
jgi:hypothetical protein